MHVTFSCKVRCFWEILQDSRLPVEFDLLPPETDSFFLRWRYPSIPRSNAAHYPGLTTTRTHLHRVVATFTYTVKYINKFVTKIFVLERAMINLYNSCFNNSFKSLDSYNVLFNAANANVNRRLYSTNKQYKSVNTLHTIMVVFER